MKTMKKLQVALAAAALFAETKEPEGRWVWVITRTGLTPHWVPVRKAA